MMPRSRTLLLFVLDVLMNVAVIVFLVFVIRSFIVSPFRVSGPSMCDTFNDYDGRCLHGNGEFIMIYKLGYLNVLGWQIGVPDRGDVVVFRPPHDEKGDSYIKRVIGLPGEVVEIRDNYVYVINDDFPEGLKLDESVYLNSANWGHTEVPSDRTRFEVPEDHWFVLGDNRRVSSDSRRCFEQSGCTSSNTPFITMEHIQGRAWVVMWPLNRLRLVERPAYSAAE